MNFPLPRVSKLAVAVAASSILALSSAPAQNNGSATTDPVGFITLNIAAAAAGSSQLSFKGLGMTRPVEYQGSAENVGTNTVTDNEATWTDDQFNGANGAYFLEVTSGPGAGTMYDISATSGANKTITLAQNLAATVANGITFKVRKHWTIASVFGPNNEAGLQGGDVNTADEILLQNGAAFDVYYFQTGAGWRKSTDAATDAGGTKIFPDEGLIVRRKGNTPVNVVLMGAVKTGATSVPVVSGVNVISNVYASNLTLASSNIYTGDPATGIAPGSVTSADQVLLWNGTGYDVYFYQVGGFGPGWRSGADVVTDAGATPIPVGSSFIVKRLQGAPFDWKIPQHPATL